MKTRFGSIPLGGKFTCFPSGTIFMKIKEVKEELLLERKPVLWNRNAVVIDGPENGELGLFADSDEVELILSA